MTAVPAIKLPDGTIVEIGDWTHHAFYSVVFAEIFWYVDAWYVQPPYTIAPGETPPPSVTLAEWAQRCEQPLWPLLCLLREVQARAHVRRSRRARWGHERAETRLLLKYSATLSAG